MVLHFSTDILDARASRNAQLLSALSKYLNSCHHYIFRETDGKKFYQSCIKRVKFINGLNSHDPSAFIARGTYSLSFTCANSALYKRN